MEAPILYLGIPNTSEPSNSAPFDTKMGCMNRRLTQMNADENAFIRMHPCSSAVKNSYPTGLGVPAPCPVSELGRFGVQQAVFDQKSVGGGQCQVEVQLVEVKVEEAVLSPLEF